MSVNLGKNIALISSLPESDRNKLLKEAALREKARRHIFDYTLYTFPGYIVGPHHKLICSYLDEWAYGDLYRLMIFTPPQHGKPLSLETPILIPDLSQVPLGNIKKGDFVISHTGASREVLEVYDQGKLPTIKLITANGRVLYPAYDHPFLTKEGWKKACNLVPHDVLAVISLKRIVSSREVEEAMSKCFFFEDRVKTIELAGDMECRCLSIDKDETFCADHLIVHNSELVSRRLPSFILGKLPSADFVGASYAAGLIESMSRDARSIMNSQYYREVFPKIRLSKTRKAVQNWETNHGGTYRCMGVGGGITGFGFTHGVIDDPVKGYSDAVSDSVREMTWNWYRSDFYTRMRPGFRARILVNMTRWHEDDLAGRILDLEKTNKSGHKFTIIKLPALYLKKKPDKLLGRSFGDALWPQMFSKKDLIDKKRTLGSVVFDALYQQRPRPAGETKIKVDWFKVIESPPDGLNWYRFWDLAVSKKTRANYTATCSIAINDQADIFVKGMIRDRMSWPETKNLMVRLARDERTIQTGFETSGQQQGFLDELVSDPLLCDISFVGTRPDTDKLTRALPWIAKAALGKVYLVAGSWVDKFKEECSLFTGIDDKFDDQVDAVSGAYHMVSHAGGIEVWTI